MEILISALLCGLSQAELVGTYAGLIVVMSFETIRRRLQVQARGIAKPVESQPLPCGWIVDAFWRTITEERSISRKAGVRRRILW